MAFRIFMHALRMVFYDLWAVIRVSMPVILVVVLAVALFWGRANGPMILIQDGPSQMPDGGEIGRFILLGIAYIVALFWTAVSWHRYCLLAERPGVLLPKFHPSEILGYFGRILLLGIMGLAVGAAGGFVIGFIGVFGSVGQVIAVVLGVIGFAVLFWVFQRLSIILPAAAVGKKLSMGEAWEATEPLSKVVLGVAGMLVAFGIAIGLATTLLTLISPILGGLANMLSSWLQMMVGLSILTTLYGVAVEGREID